MRENPERLNIRHINVPKSFEATPLPFDPEKEITREDIRVGRAYVESQFDRLPVAPIGDVLEESFCLRILDPDFSASRENLLKIKSELEHERFYSSGPSLATNLAHARILAPEFLVPSPEDLEVVRKAFASVRGTSRIRLLAHAKILVIPETDALVQEVCPADSVETTLAILRGYSGREVKEQMANLKILGIRFELDALEWEKMRGDLSLNRRSSDKGGFIRRAAYMKIIAAEKVEVTEQGLKITMPESGGEMREKIPPVPESSRLP